MGGQGGGEEGRGGIRRGRGEGLAVSIVSSGRVIGVGWGAGRRLAAACSRRGAPERRGSERLWLHARPAHACLCCSCTRKVECTAPPFHYPRLATKAHMQDATASMHACGIDSTEGVRPQSPHKGTTARQPACEGQAIDVGRGHACCRPPAAPRPRHAMPVRVCPGHLGPCSAPPPPPAGVL